MAIPEELLVELPNTYQLKDYGHYRSELLTLTGKLQTYVKSTEAYVGRLERMNHELMDLLKSTSTVEVNLDD